MITAFPRAMPVEGLFGGLLIGFSAAIMLVGNGRIAAVAGIGARALGIAASGTPRVVAATFILGLILGSGLVALLFGEGATRYPAETWQMVVGGLLVGYATRLGSDCASGHGVCGIARLLPRSVAATLIFVGSDVTTVALSRCVGPL